MCLASKLLWPALLTCLSLIGSAQRTVIQGTHISIVPPTGFVLTGDSATFLSESAPGISLSVFGSSSTMRRVRDSLAADDAWTASGTDTLMVADGLGLRLNMTTERGGAGGRPLAVLWREVLIGRVGERTAFVDAVYPADAPREVWTTVTTALASVRAAPGDRYDPMAALPFAVDLSAGGLTFEDVHFGRLYAGRRLADSARSFDVSLAIDLRSAPREVTTGLALLDSTFAIFRGYERFEPDGGSEAVEFGGREAWLFRGRFHHSEQPYATTRAIVVLPGGEYATLIGNYRIGDPVGQSDAEAIMATFRLRE